VRTLAVDSDEILWPRVALCGGTCACFLRGLEAVVDFIYDWEGGEDREDKRTQILARIF
jgi:hypothetical protein